MLDFFRNKPLALIPLAVVIGGLAWLAFGFFGVHTLFIDDVVDEAAPSFDQPADPGATTLVPDPMDGEMQRETGDDDMDVPAGGPVPDEMLSDDVEMDEDMPPMDEPGSDGVAPGAIVAEFEGSFESGAHPTSGRAVVLGNGTGQRFLRFEDFETDNGPDLNVWLVNSSAGSVTDDFVDLGDLKGNIGSQNYEIPEGLDLEVYDTVYIWCVRFGVGFGDAELTAV